MFSGTVGRLAYAILCGIGIFIIIYVVALLLRSATPDVASLMMKFDVVIAVLVALVVFFGNFHRPAA